MWTLITFQPTVCPTPPEGRYSTLSVTSGDSEVPAVDTYWPDTTIKYTCDSGYELKLLSSSRAVCDSDGNWDVTLPPTCHPGTICCLNYYKTNTIT